MESDATDRRTGMSRALDISTSVLRDDYGALALVNIGNFKIDTSYNLH